MEKLLLGLLSSDRPIDAILELRTHGDSSDSFTCGRHWSSRINHQLNSASSDDDRMVGALLVHHASHHAPQDFLTTNITSWLTALLPCVNQCRRTALRESAVMACSGLLRYTAMNIPALRRDVSTSFIPRYITHLLTMLRSNDTAAAAAASGSNDDILIALSGLRECLAAFPTALRSSYDDIMICCIRLIMNCSYAHSSPVVVSGAMKTLAMLPNSGGGKVSTPLTVGAETLPPASVAWGILLRRVLGSLNDALDGGLVSIVQHSSSISSSTRISLDNIEDIPDFPSTPLLKPMLFIRRAEVLCELLYVLLGSVHDQKVVVPVEGFLDTIARMLTVDRYSTVDSSSPYQAEHPAVIALAHVLVCSGLRVLDALIATCGSGMLQYTRTVVRLCTQCIIGEGTAVSSVRRVAYTVLANCLEVLGPEAVCLSTTFIVEPLCRDISSSVGRIKDNQVDNKLAGVDEIVTKQKRKRRRGDQPDSGATETTGPSSNDCNGYSVSAAALDLVRVIALCGGRSLEPQCVSTLAEIMLTTASSFGPRVRAPYTIPGLRARLITATVQLVTAGGFSIAPWISRAVVVVSTARTDTAAEVRLAAADASLLLDAVLHPRVPTVGASRMYATLVVDNASPEVTKRNGDFGDNNNWGSSSNAVVFAATNDKWGFNNVDVNKEEVQKDALSATTTSLSEPGNITTRVHHMDVSQNQAMTATTSTSSVSEPANVNHVHHMDVSHGHTMTATAITAENASHVHHADKSDDVRKDSVAVYEHQECASLLPSTIKSTTSTSSLTQHEFVSITNNEASSTSNSLKRQPTDAIIYNDEGSDSDCMVECIDAPPSDDDNN